MDEKSDGDDVKQGDDVACSAPGCALAEVERIAAGFNVYAEDAGIKVPNMLAAKSEIRKTAPRMRCSRSWDSDRVTKQLDLTNGSEVFMKLVTRT